MISLKRLLIVTVALLGLTWGYIGIQHYTTPVYEGTAIIQVQQEVKTCPCGCGVALGQCGCPADATNT
jgi:hypothetical protein